MTKERPWSSKREAAWDYMSSGEANRAVAVQAADLCFKCWIEHAGRITGQPCIHSNFDGSSRVCVGRGSPETLRPVLVQSRELDDHLEHSAPAEIASHVITTSH